MRRIATIGVLSALMLALTAGVALAANLVGTNYSETIYGTNSADTIDGRGGHDLLVGQGGPDRLLGGPGDDYLVAAYGYWQTAPNAPASRDVIDGGDGHDLIDAADKAGAPDDVRCGPGVDDVYAGVEDNVSRDCEYVYRYYGY